MTRARLAKIRRAADAFVVSAAFAVVVFSVYAGAIVLAWALGGMR